MSEIGPLTLLAIAIRALGYGTGLLAVGSALFLALYAGRAFPASDPSAVSRIMRRTAWIGGMAALLAAVALAAGVGVRAARLSGMGIGGMAEPMMLRIVWEGPVGTAVLVRLAGLAAALLGLMLFRSAMGRFLAVAGAAAFALSHAFVGHAAFEPRWLFGALIGVHLVAIAFWLGALAPLAMATRCLALADAAGLLSAFGRAASVAVAALVVAGAGFAALLVEAPGGLIVTGYGRIMLFKLALVIVLLALAARNKLLLVPELAAGSNHARRAVTVAIWLEVGVMAGILMTTALMTSTATPPARMLATT